MLRFVRDIDPGKIRRKVVVDVIGDVEIPLPVRPRIRRVGQCALALIGEAGVDDCRLEQRA